MKYKLMISDCPWPYARHWDNKAKYGGLPYSSMTIHDLQNLGLFVKEVMDKDSLCLMWSTGPKQEEALSVLKAWGFKFITIVFTWLKRTKSGKIYSGLGQHTNSNQEYVLLGKRGKGCKRIAKNIKQVIEAVRGKHSAKPPELHERVHKLYGQLPSLELFGRQRVSNWDVLGNELSGLDISAELTELINNTWFQR